MDDFERVNQKRIDAILKYIDLIKKSAKSNRADPTPLLAQVRSCLGGGGGMPKPTAMPAPAATSSVAVGAGTIRNASSYAGLIGPDGKLKQGAVNDLAQLIPLSDLAALVALTVDRMDREIYEGNTP